jgi:hypothetical protein
MNCRQIDELIFDYCENKLPDDLMKAVQEHIKQCSFCSNNEKWTRLENKILAKPVNIPPLSEDFAAKVMQPLQSGDEMAACDKANRPKRRTIYTVLGALAIAAVIMLAVKIPALQQPETVPQQVAQKNTQNIAAPSITEQKLSGQKDELLKSKAAGSVESFEILDANKADQAPQEEAQEQNIIAPASNDRLMVTEMDSSRSAIPLAKIAAVHPAPAMPIPVGVPAQYNLIKHATEEQCAVYYYSSSDSLTNFTLAISQSPPEAENGVKEAMDASSPVSNEPAFNGTLEYEGKKYKVELTVISGQVNLKDLLASIHLAAAPEDNPNKCQSAENAPCSDH